MAAEAVEVWSTVLGLDHQPDPPGVLIGDDPVKIASLGSLALAEVFPPDRCRVQVKRGLNRQD